MTKKDRTFRTGLMQKVQVYKGLIQIGEGYYITTYDNHGMPIYRGDYQGFDGSKLDEGWYQVVPNSEDVKLIIIPEHIQ